MPEEIRDCMCDGQEGLLEFSRSIIKGVEIKRCRSVLHAYKPHVHNELSLGYIVEGSTDLSLNDNTLQFEAGDGVIIPALMTHRCAPKDMQHWAYEMLFVDPAYYCDVVRFHQATRLTGSRAHKLIEFIEQLLLENNQDALENILIDLLLEFGDEDTCDPAVANMDALIREIHDYILKNVREAITLDMLEEVSGLNRFTIIRNFKKQYVTTPAAYHLQFRVAEAKSLLSMGANVFDVCEELRFYDQSHLIREFKKMYGITPAYYTEQLKA